MAGAGVRPGAERPYAWLVFVDPTGAAWPGDTLTLHARPVEPLALPPVEGYSLGFEVASITAATDPTAFPAGTASEPAVARHRAGWLHPLALDVEPGMDALWIEAPVRLRFDVVPVVSRVRLRAGGPPRAHLPRSA